MAENEEVVEEIEADAEVEEAAAEPRVRVRGRGGGSTERKLTKSDVPYPKGIHGEDYEDYSSAGFAATPVGEITASSADQPFTLDEELLETLSFDKPGRNLPKKRLYNIKGIHRDGRIVQLPFEPQVQNNAGGDPEDAIGMRRYQRKGITLLWDPQSMIPIYCAAWDCWAQAAQNGNYVGFCTVRHAQHTLPNAYKDAGKIVSGLMEQGVTTTRTWGV